MVLGMRKRISIDLQATASECGLACLTMIYGHFGYYMPMGDLRRHIDTGRDGASMLQLARHARSMGLDATGVRMAQFEPDAIPLPAIVTWERSHFVVVERADKAGVSVIDPATGRSRLTMTEFRKSFGGTALFFAPTSQFQKRSQPRLGFLRFLAPFVPSTRWPLYSILLLALLVMAFGLLPPALTGYVVDSVVGSDDKSTLSVLAWFVAIFTAAYIASVAFRSELTLWLETRLDGAITSAFVDKLLELPYKFFLVRQTGDILVRAASTTYMRDAFSSRLFLIVTDSLFITFYLVIIGLQSSLFLAILLGGMAIQVVAIVLLTSRIRTAADKELSEMSNSQSLLLETVYGIETIRSAGLSLEANKRWRESFQAQLHASVTRRRLDNVLTAVLTTISFGLPSCLLLVGALGVLNHEATLGGTLSLIALSGAALAPISALGAGIQALQTAKVHMSRLEDVFGEDSEDTRPEGKTLDFKGALSLDSVSFRYGDNAPMAVAEVSCTVRSGEFLAIVGPSGSGKSTLARVMIGLMHPTSGVLHFDGVPITELNLASLRQQIGTVVQASTAMSGTIGSNIKFGRADISDADVVWACRVAMLDHDLARMPLGVDTPLGEAGTGLSGGQLQRLALARAIASKPRLLLLDEATSSLDGPTEEAIAENIALGLSCTRVVIAHRLSTVCRADRIIFMKEGKIRSIGTHEELQQTDEQYLEFVGNQQMIQPEAEYR
jgi:ABC-type bacteriocin/lantibiotic exporter with double-glycine peptidase domain